MPAQYYRPGDVCWLEARVCNAGPVALTGYPLLVVLDVFGEYWFAPGWSQSLDFYLVDLAAGELLAHSVIPEFHWPEDVGSADGIVFWGALCNQEITEVIGVYDRITFGWGE